MNVKRLVVFLAATMLAATGCTQNNNDAKLKKKVRSRTAQLQQLQQKMDELEIESQKQTQEAKAATLAAEEKSKASIARMSQVVEKEKKLTQQTILMEEQAFAAAQALNEAVEAKEAAEDRMALASENAKVLEQSNVEAQKALEIARKRLEEAQKAAAKTKADAQSSAKATVSNAEAKADRVQSDARSKAEELVASGETQKSAAISEGEQKKSDLIAEGEQQKSDLIAEGQQQKSDLIAEGDALKSEVAREYEEAKKDAEQAARLLATGRDTMKRAEQNLATAESILADAHEQQKRVGAAAAVWKATYESIGEGALMESLMKDEPIVVQLSVFGMAPLERVMSIREQVAALNANASYQKSAQLIPSEDDRSVIRAVNKGLLSKDFAANDRIMVQASGVKIADFLDSLKAGNKEGSNLLAVVRPVDQLRVSMSIEVKSRDEMIEGDGTFKALSQRLASFDVGGLTQIQSLDLEKPGQYILGVDRAEVCSVISEQCLQELAREGLLDAKVPDAAAKKMLGESFDVAQLKQAQKTVKGILSLALQRSSEQLVSDSGMIINGIEEIHLSPVAEFFQGLSRRGITKRVTFDENLQRVVEYVDAEEYVEPVRKPILEEVSLRFQVSLISKLPMDNRIHADLFFNRGSVEEITVETLANGEIEIDLPISSNLVQSQNYSEIGMAFAMSQSASTPKDKFLQSVTEQVAVKRNLSRMLDR